MSSAAFFYYNYNSFMKKYLLYIGICYHKPKRCHFAVHLGTKTLGYVEIDSESFQTILRGKLVSLFCISRKWPWKCYTPETRFSELRFSEILNLMNKLQLPFLYFTLYVSRLNLVNRLHLLNKRVWYYVH